MKISRSQTKALLLIGTGVLVSVVGFLFLRPDSKAPSFNADDVMFAQMMLPHHLQAIDMAAMVLAPGRRSSRELQSLARGVQSQQSSEVIVLEKLLSRWRADTEGSHHMGMMDGMLSADELRRLNSLHGTEFDHAWSVAMIKHHQGAIAMARDVLRAGVNQRIASLASDVVAAQSQEIRELRTIATATSN